MDLTGLIAVIGAFGIGPAIVYLRGRHKLEERRLELEARTGGSGNNNSETKRLTEENKLLRERVENLESIVCSVDYELNQKLAKMIDESRAGLGLPPAPAAKPTDGKSETSGALDRTATAQVTPSKNSNNTPLTTTFEAGQVIAQRYRIQRLLGKGGM